MTESSQNNEKSTIVRSDFHQFDAAKPSKKLSEKLQEASKENAGRWTHEEHELFLKGLAKFGKGWKKIAGMISTRTVVQVRTHAQKYFQKLEKERQKVGMNTRSDSFPTDVFDQMKKIENIKSIDMSKPQASNQNLNLIPSDEKKKDDSEYSEFTNSNNSNNSKDKGFSNLHLIPDNLSERINSKQESGYLLPNVGYSKILPQKLNESCRIQEDIPSQQQPLVYSKPYKLLAPFPLAPLKTFGHETYVVNSSSAKNFKHGSGGSSPTSVDDISLLRIKGLPYGTMTPKTIHQETKSQTKTVPTKVEMSNTDFSYDDLFDASSTLDWYFKEIDQNENTDLSSPENISAVFNKDDEKNFILPKIAPEPIKDFLNNGSQNLECIDPYDFFDFDILDRNSSPSTTKNNKIKVKQDSDDFLQPQLKKCKFSSNNQIDDLLFEVDMNSFQNRIFNLGS